MGRTVSQQSRLEIFILPDCAGVVAATDNARLVRRTLGESVTVDIIDLSMPDVIRPETVFAVPTYVLNGQRISLGNPSGDQLIATIQASQGRMEQ